MAEETATVEDTETEDTTTTETDDKSVETEVDWKAESRKHERRSKQTAKELEETRRKLQEREDADKSEQDKAIDEAKRAAREEALTEAQKERRADRLEVAVTRLATKGIKVGDDLAKFADPEDVLTYLDRAIAKGDLNADDIFNEESQVQTEALTDTLADLAKRKPHWLEGHKPAGPGDSDAGKGSGGAKGLEDMTVEDHAKRKYGR